MNDVTFVATRRNGRALCFGGYYYHINKSVEERSYWKCRTKGCKSTVVTINDVISSASGQHFHDPNDSRVIQLFNNDNNVQTNHVDNNLVNDLRTDNNKQLIISANNKKQRNSNESLNYSLSNKKFKSNNHNRSTNSNNSNNNNNKSLSLITEHLNIDSEEVIDSFVQHLNVELEVDECGKVKIEEIDESYNNNETSSELVGESSGPKKLQLMPNIKPNSVYFANNSYTNIEHFDIELNNLFKVIRQSGFKSIDIEQLSNDWELWKKRYLELKKARVKSKQFGTNEREVENLKLQLEIAVNAKNNAEKEIKRLQMSLRESQNNVSALKLVLRKNLNNGSNNQCIALLNEINELKRKVCAQVETHQSNLNEVKRLLCLDDNDLRTEFDQLAQERDDALRDNLQLKQELSLLRDQLSAIDKSD